MQIALDTTLCEPCAAGQHDFEGMDDVMPHCICCGTPNPDEDRS